MTQLLLAAVLHGCRSSVKRKMSSRLYGSGFVWPSNEGLLSVCVEISLPARQQRLAGLAGREVAVKLKSDMFLHSPRLAGVISEACLDCDASFCQSSHSQVPLAERSRQIWDLPANKKRRG